MRRRLIQPRLSFLSSRIVFQCDLGTDKHRL